MEDLERTDPAATAADRPTDQRPTGPPQPTDRYPQPVQEIVDPKDPNPLEGRERTDVSAYRAPRSEEGAARTDAEEETIPYETISDLPSDEVEQYNDEQREAFRASYNSALEQFGGDKRRALEIGHAAARGTPGDR